MFKIFVENKQLEIPDKNFSVTLELADTLNLEGGKSSKSTSIDIPLNVNNENILDLTKKFVDAELVSGWFSIRGILYFLEVKKEINRKTLKAQFVWQTGTFVENNKNKLLSDLDISVNFTYNYTTLTNSWNNTEKYVFDFCSRGKRIEEFNTAYTATDLKPFHLVEFFPAIRLTEILKAIFKGYTFDSDFITNNPDYFLLFTQDKAKQTKDEAKYHTALMELSADINSNLTFLTTANVWNIEFPASGLLNDIIFNSGSNGGAYNNLGIYELKNNASLRIKFDITINYAGSFAAGSNPNPTFELQLILKRSGVDYVVFSDIRTFTNSGTFFHQMKFDYDLGYVNMLIGDKLRFRQIGFGTKFNGDTSMVSIVVLKDISYFHLSSNINIGAGAVCDNLNIFLPEIEQLKFLKGLIQMFNLYILIDENQKKVFLDKKSDFYSKSAINYTDYIDISKEIVNEIQQEKIVKLGLKLDNSDDNQKEENKFNTYFYNDNGETQENINEVFSATTIGMNQVDKILCPILHSKENGNNPYYYSDEYKTKFELRILKYEGVKNCADYKLLYGTSLESMIEIQENTLTTYPLFTSYGGSENLVFNTQNGLSGLESNFTESLQQIVNGEKITFEAILPIDILTNLMLGGVTGDLRYPIYIGIAPFEGYYEIQKVENITGYSNRVKIEALKKFENTYITK